MTYTGFKYSSYDKKESVPIPSVPYFFLWMTSALNPLLAIKNDQSLISAMTVNIISEIPKRIS